MIDLLIDRNEKYELTLKLKKKYINNKNDF